MICPDCGTQFAIPEPPPRRRKPKVRKAEEIPARGPVKRPPLVIEGFKPLEDGGKLEPLAEEEDDERRLADHLPPERERAKLPAWPLVSGVFSFPFQAGARSRWFFLSLTGCMLASFQVLAILMARSQVEGMGGAPILIASMIFFGLVFVTGLMWAVWVCLVLLAIVQDTASAIDNVESWPASDWIDQVFHAFFIVISVVMSGIVGLGLDYLIGLAGGPTGLGFLLGVWLGFPILLLSYLETGTFWNFLSKPVWRSLGIAWPGWVGFFVLSGLLGLSGVTAGAVCTEVLGIWGYVPEVAINMGCLMIYFRMLGRLGWYCAEREEEWDRSRRRAERALEA
jgi:hypothetical protein